MSLRMLVTAGFIVRMAVSMLLVGLVNVMFTEHLVGE